MPPGYDWLMLLRVKRPEFKSSSNLGSQVPWLFLVLDPQMQSEADSHMSTEASPMRGGGHVGVGPLPGPSQGPVLDLDPPWSLAFVI